MHVTRVLLFTGKGGVGKTTVAAATAVRAAESGLRTIVSETVAQQISEQLNIRFVTSDRAQSSRLGA